MRAIIFDTETTGLTLPRIADPSKQPRIIEMAMRIVDASTGERLEDFESLVNPEMTISDENIKITGITNEMVALMPTFKAYMPGLASIFQQADILLAHNAPFDVAVLNYELLRAGGSQTFPWPKQVICTAHEYVSLIGFLPHLKDLYLKVMGVELEQVHRAMPDVDALHRILLKDNFFQKIGMTA
jgi:DNA polymerase III epsilon subunit-like protein